MEIQVRCIVVVVVWTNWLLQERDECRGEGQTTGRDGISEWMGYLEEDEEMRRGRRVGVG